MMSNPFSVLRLRQQRVRLLFQQLIKREHLNEQQVQEGVRERQRAVMQGRYGDYAFRTLGRPPPAPPPRQSLLPGQANEQAPPGGERSTLDFQADFERAEESGKIVRGELRGEEDADSRSVRERGGEERVARGRDALEDAPREEDFFLQPIGQPTQGDAQGGQSGTGGDSGRNPSGQGDRGGGERGPGQHAAVPERLQHLQQILGRFETGIADPDPQVRADTLVAALAEIVWAKHGIGHPVQAMLLARIARYLNEQQEGEALLNTVGKVREALLQVGLQGAGMPSDRFALLPLQLLNCSRPRTGEQRRLVVERLDGGSAWLASHRGPRA